MANQENLVVFTATQSVVKFFKDYCIARQIDVSIHLSLQSRWMDLCAAGIPVIIDLDDFYNTKSPQNAFVFGMTSAKDRADLLHFRQNGWQALLFKPLNAKSLSSLLLSVGREVVDGDLTSAITRLNSCLLTLDEQSLPYSVQMIEDVLREGVVREVESLVISAANETACRLSQESKPKLAIKFLTSIFSCTLSAGDSYVLHYNLSSLHLSQKEIALAQKYYEICISRAPNHFTKSALLKLAIESSRSGVAKASTGLPDQLRGAVQRSGASLASSNTVVNSNVALLLAEAPVPLDVAIQPEVRSEDELRSQRIHEFILFKTNHI